MKIKLNFKTPYGAQGAVCHLNEEDQDKALSIIDRYVNNDESVSIEFDIETGEAKVLRVAK